MAAKTKVEKLKAQDKGSEGVVEKISAREQILQTATRLFYEQGFRAVGIDIIIAESGVAKMTLYKHFPSKDDLIRAYLERSNEGWWNWVDEVTKPFQNNPRKQLELIFEGVAKLASSPQCLGCTFTSAAGEFPSLEHIGHAAALRHKKQVLEKFKELAKAANLRQPQVVSEQLLMLMDGAWNAARMFGPGNHAKQVADAAKIILNAYAS